MAQAAFWISRESVFNFGGKDYKYGDKLPTGVDDAAVTAFIKKGKASRTAPSAPAVAPGEVEVLKEQVATLRSERDKAEESAREGSVKIEQLTTELATVRGELAAANQTIEQLTTELATVRGELAAANQTIEQLTATALTPGVGPKEGEK